MTQKGIILIIAFLIDCVMGDPHCIYHPVRFYGFVIAGCEKLLWSVLGIKEAPEEDKNKKRLAGAGLVIITIAALTGLYMAILWLAEKINEWLYLSLAVIICYQLIAAKSLFTESMKVYYAFDEGIDRARAALSMIVGRDTGELTEGGICRGAVETVAENFSDGVVAPVFYFILFGPVGMVVYKAVNTMDSMIGYKNDRYRYFGTAAARLDDVLNFIPARIAAGLLLAACCVDIKSFSFKEGLRIYFRDRYKHKSPNSAHCEAVMAGALGIRLAGPASYFGVLQDKPYIGDGTREISKADIKLANKLMYAGAVAGILLYAAVIALMLYIC